ncbi:MAG TPA: glycine zipper domain-containing protein [Sphingobium sp.]|jgi:hypothetical protein
MRHIPTRLLLIPVLAGGALALTACSHGATRGGLIGGAGGAVVGSATGLGTTEGAIIGGTAGAIIGDNDHKKKRRHRRD